MADDRQRELDEIAGDLRKDSRELVDPEAAAEAARKGADIQDQANKAGEDAAG